MRRKQQVLDRINDLEKELEKAKAELNKPEKVKTIFDIDYMDVYYSIDMAGATVESHVKRNIPWEIVPYDFLTREEGEKKLLHDKIEQRLKADAMIAWGELERDRVGKNWEISYFNKSSETIHVCSNNDYMVTGMFGHVNFPTKLSAKNALLGIKDMLCKYFDIDYMMVM